MNNEEYAYRALLERLSATVKRKAMNPNRLSLDDLKELLGMSRNALRCRGIRPKMTVEQVVVRLMAEEGEDVK